MKIEVYTFTGTYPSGNLGSYLYDETCHTIFANSIDCNLLWNKLPKIGDKITFYKDDSLPSLPIRKVFINNILVYEFSQEKEDSVTSFFNKQAHAATERFLTRGSNLENIS
jgi:hypothetical protein